MTDCEKTDPRGYDPPMLPEPSPADYVRMFGEVVDDKLRPVRHLMAVLTTQTTNDRIKVGKRLSILEATKLAPTILYVAIALTGCALAANAAQASASIRCPPSGVGGAQ